MIKKQQKWIALLVTLTFALLLQVSTMPLSSAGAAEQVSAAQAGQAPDFVEQEDSGGNQPKKKSILPVVLIGIGVVAVAAVVLFLVAAKGYDITGTWTVYYTWPGDPEDDFSITFSGDKKAGTFIYLEKGSTDSGTYAVDVKNVEWTFSGGTKYIGTFSDKENMSGTTAPYPGTWRAIKISGAAAVESHAAVNEKKGLNGAGQGAH